MTISDFTMRRADLHSGQIRECQNPKKTTCKRQPESLFLVLAVEDQKLMAQGKDFCLECNSHEERITEDREKEK